MNIHDNLPDRISRELFFENWSEALLLIEALKRNVKVIQRREKAAQKRHNESLPYPYTPFKLPPSKS
jgi:hypothetical protein